MIKRRYMKNVFIEEAYCDKCGAMMLPGGVALDSFPPLYPFKCTNPLCNATATFTEENLPGQLKWEFEDEVVDVPEEGNDV